MSEIEINTYKPDKIKNNKPDFINKDYNEYLKWKKEKEGENAKTN